VGEVDPRQPAVRREVQGSDVPLVNGLQGALEDLVVVLIESLLEGLRALEVPQGILPSLEVNPLGPLLVVILDEEEGIADVGLGRAREEIPVVRGRLDEASIWMSMLGMASRTVS